MSEVTAASAAMHERDQVAKGLQIDISRAVTGGATASMTVTHAMTNGLGTCHGGVIFSLADTAMGHASNAGDERSLATTASIEWVKAAKQGDRLTATSRTVDARAQHRARHRRRQRCWRDHRDLPRPDPDPRRIGRRRARVMIPERAIEHRFALRSTKSADL